MGVHQTAKWALSFSDTFTFSIGVVRVCNANFMARRVVELRKRQ